MRTSSHSRPTLPRLAVVALAVAASGGCGSLPPEPPSMTVPLAPGPWVLSGDGDAPRAARPIDVPVRRARPPVRPELLPWQDVVSLGIDVDRAWAVGFGLGLREASRVHRTQPEEAAVHGVALWLSFSF